MHNINTICRCEQEGTKVGNENSTEKGRSRVKANEKNKQRNLSKWKHNMCSVKPPKIE